MNNGENYKTFNKYNNSYMIKLYNKLKNYKSDPLFIPLYE